MTDTPPVEPPADEELDELFDGDEPFDLVVDEDGAPIVYEGLDDILGD